MIIMHVYVCVCIYSSSRGEGVWLRTSGVNTNEAAAKVMNFDRLGKTVCPGTIG